MRSNGREDIKNAHILALNMPHMNFSYKGNFSLVCAKSHDLMDYGPPGTSVHGIFEARILEQVASSLSRGFSRPRYRTGISCIACIGRYSLYHCAPLGSPELLLTINKSIGHFLAPGGDHYSFDWQYD